MSLVGAPPHRHGDGSLRVRIKRPGRTSKKPSQAGEEARDTGGRRDELTAAALP
jgi:hypothetical protein